MNISPRTQSLLNLVPPNHSLAAAMRGVIIAVSAANEGFAGRKIALEADPGRTPVGRRDELRKDLTEKRGKALQRAEQSVRKVRAEAKAKHAALVVKPADPANAIGDWEIRTWFNAKDIGAKHATALSMTDPDILHAILLKPELSGLAGLPPLIIDGRPTPVIDLLQERYKEAVYPNELAELEAIEAVIVPAEQAVGIARNEMASTADMRPHDFGEMMQSIEPDQPWLTSDKRQVIEIVDGKASYRPATADEIEHGRLFSPAEYQASRVA